MTHHGMHQPFDRETTMRSPEFALVMGLTVKRAVKFARDRSCYSVLTQQFSVQPGLGDAPLSLDGSRGSFHHVSSFLYAQAAKEPQLYNPRLIGIARGQTAQRLVYGQHFRSDRVHHRVGTLGLERQLRYTTAAFERLPASGMIDQNAAHEAGGDSKKLSSVLPGCASLTHELEEEFVHQRCGLQRVIRAFVT